MCRCYRDCFKKIYTHNHGVIATTCEMFTAFEQFKFTVYTLAIETTFQFTFLTKPDCVIRKTK